MKTTAIVLTLCCFASAASAAGEPTGTATPPTATAPEKAKPTLDLGMTAEQIVQIAGKPERVKKMKQEGIDAEVWYYSFKKAAGTTMVATSVQEIPYFDPLTGVMKTLKEPVHSLAHDYLVETTELLMIDGKLAQAKRYRSLKRDID